jgi:hypothetical protein
MQNAAGGDASAPFDDQEANCWIASNLVSLVERVQASMKLIEQAFAQYEADGAATGHRQSAGLTGRA